MKCLKKLFILLILCLLTFTVTQARRKRASVPHIPILGWYSIPPGEHATLEHYREMREAGFDYSFSHIYKYEDAIQALDLCAKVGMKSVFMCPELKTEPEETVRRVMKHPGLGMYFLRDEPKTDEMQDLGDWGRRINAVDPKHPCYLNLLPGYGPEYEASLRAFSERIGLPQISFDHYPITTNGVRKTWYQNLEMIRQESLSSGKPFWGFALSIAHNVPYTPNTYYPIATLASLRLQIYTNLAYGAQAIQYFTYWHPGENDMLKFHDAPISRDGKKTKTYYVVQKMNQELKPVARLFYGAKVTAVHHLGGTIPEGGSRLSEMPKNLSLLKVVGRQGGTISQFTKNGHQYLAIVNKSPKAKLTIRLKTRNQTPLCITKKLQAVKIKNSYTVQPGDILIFRLG